MAQHRPLRRRALGDRPRRDQQSTHVLHGHGGRWDVEDDGQRRSWNNMTDGAANARGQAGGQLRDPQNKLAL